ncbi:MAG: hypothetical protein IPL84_18530 [Chitinophagaceae bacterium]|nr:hypothetical protein [Chitinophagaceae bacterium]
MKQQNQNDELYKLYGQFLINFEYVSHLMRFGILRIIFPGYDARQTRQNEILMEALTADQIRNKFMALIAEDFKSHTDIFKLSKSIPNIYQRLIPIRNSFAHGTSFVGESSLVKDSKHGQIILRHPKLKSVGLDLNFKTIDINALILGIELFEKLRYAVGVVTITIQTKINGKEDSGAYKSDRHLESTRLSLERLEKKIKRYTQIF